ncbi:MAG: PAC2 family protein [Acidimicrobiaceae bacterium]|nr:PAC2 family protein [Acidimicrobiaceae bacterium]MYD06994.1 PAC2 family protein [Acidimicrobiaceae bacterium]MYI58308.1 PAC2 family protein [Acidimicrobiaceae bacterium]
MVYGVASSASSPAHINWLTNLPKLRSPVLITAFEGWNDAGDAASIAARHFADRWKGTALAEIDAEHFYDFTTSRPLVRLDQERRRSLTWPTNLFRSCVVRDGEQDVVVLLGLEPQLRWRTFCNQVIETARMLEVSQVITLGALLADVPHSRPVEVYGASDDEKIRARLDLAPSSYEGPTGIVGVLATQCREAGLPTASLWSAVPSYVPGAPSPKAGLALVQRVSELLGTSVFATDLEIAAATYEHQVNELVAEDEETASYVADLEEAWDGNVPFDTDADPDLSDDPETLLAEVEQFLRDND